MARLKLYPHNPKIKRALSGCVDFVIKDGLNYLIPEWKRFVKNVDEDDGSIIYEYLNDVDTRDIINKILPYLADNEKIKIEIELQEYDAIFVSKTFETEECLWGTENEIAKGWTRQENFYYYKAPQHLIDREPEIEKI
ncbi:MAG TPA: hypothetical protein VIH86_07750 [Puia sp.]